MYKLLCMTRRDTNIYYFKLYNKRSTLSYIITEIMNTMMHTRTLGQACIHMQIRM